MDGNAHYQIPSERMSTTLSLSKINELLMGKREGTWEKVRKGFVAVAVLSYLPSLSRISANRAWTLALSLANDFNDLLIILIDIKNHVRKAR